LEPILQFILIVATFVAGISLSSYLTYRLLLKGRSALEQARQKHPLWDVSPVELEHFDDASITVDWQGIDPTAYLAVSLSDEQAKLLSGAPSKSHVVVKYRSAADWAQEGTGADQPPAGLYFYASGPGIRKGLQNVVGVYQDPTAGTAGLYLKDIMLSEDLPEGAAGRMLIRMARAGLDLGIREMRCLGAGGRNWPNMHGSERWGGYVAWPSYGFDMPLLSQTAQVLPLFPNHPPGLGTCYTVSDVLAQPDGGLFWRVVGDGWFMHFDLSHDHTPSVRTLLAKVQKKGA
jgi:hypothetical protein